MSEDGALEAIRATFEIEGQGITGVRVAIPTDPETVRPFAGPEGGPFRLDFAFADPNALDDRLPSGEYVFSINGGAVEITLDYGRREIEAPSIDSPEHASERNSPRSSEFLFSTCDACDNSNDRTFVRLTRPNPDPESDGGPLIVDSAFLDPDEIQWIPLDGDDLAEDTDFTFFVVHSTLALSRESGGSFDAFLFFNWYELEDRVDFKTGFIGLDEAPHGNVALQVDDANNPIFDPSRSFAGGQFGPIAVMYGVAVFPSGKLAANGLADLDANGSFETEFAGKGRVRGKQGVLTQKLNFVIRNKTLRGQRSRVAVRQTTTIGAASRASRTVERVRGKQLGTKLKADSDFIGSAAGSSSPWSLAFDLGLGDGRTLEVSNAVLTYGDGIDVPLVGRGMYDSTTKRTVLRLRSTPPGVTLQIRNFVMNDRTAASGDVRYRAIGQRGGFTGNFSVMIPSPLP